MTRRFPSRRDPAVNAIAIKAIELLTRRREELDRLTQLLLESETVDGEAVYRLVGRPPPRRPRDEEISPGLRDQAASSPTDQQT